MVSIAPLLVVKLPPNVPLGIASIYSSYFVLFFFSALKNQTTFSKQTVVYIIYGIVFLKAWNLEQVLLPVAGGWGPAAIAIFTPKQLLAAFPLNPGLFNKDPN